MFKAICTAEFDDDWTRRFKELVTFDRVGFSLDRDPKKRYPSEQMPAVLSGYDIYVSGYEKMTASVLARCPELKLIMSVRDGPEENIDIDACTRLGIPVLFSSGRCERSVPEFAFLCMLMLAKPVLKATETFRHEHWTSDNDLKMRRITEASTELFGKTVGIVGLGRNGFGLAQRCLAFGMKVVGYDPYVDTGKVKACGISLVSLADLMASADYVSIQARVTPETVGMINKDLLGMMKKDACLINTARAALVDYDALLALLQAGRIRAALDVFVKEPLPDDSMFYSIPADRLLLTPHLAGLSVERITYQSDKLWHALDDFMHGTLPATFRNPQVMQTKAFASRGKLIFGCLK